MLKTRKELEASFKNGMRPSQTQFAELILSLVNKRDDQFFGRWRSGTTYRPGDIVIWERALWEMVYDEEICSREPPDEPYWRPLIVPSEDEDWFLVDLDEDDSGKGVGSRADHPPATMHANPRVVRVGIGTEKPNAFLDVCDQDRGQMLFDGCERPGPVLQLVHLDCHEIQHYLAAWVEEYASFVTDAPEGFAFHAGDSHTEFCRRKRGEDDTPLVAIKLDGRVGIGTEDPGERLEVTNGKSGRFLFNLDCKVNPALSIVNLRPGYKVNYLATGVDNDVAAFVTDSEYGFLFRAGGEAGEDDHEVDINQGRELVSILPDGQGKVGIGRQPQDYQLDVHGLSRVHAIYVDTNERNLDEVEPIGEVMERLCELRPVTFEWDEATKLEDPGRKIGLVAHEVDDIFPEAVKTNNDRTKAIAYHSLVAVLVKAIQEQQADYRCLERRLKRLEEHLGIDDEQSGAED